MISCASNASLRSNARDSIPTKSNRAVICQATPKMVERMQQFALVGTASALLSLSASAPAFARAAPNTSYQEELLAAVKARGGAALPSLTSSPAVEAPKQEKKSAPAAVVPAKAVEAPTPRPSINGKELPADAPTIKLPKAAKSESVGSFASYASAPASAPKAAAKKSEDGGNNNAVVLGGLVLVAVAGVAVAGGNNGEGADGAGVVPAAAAPAAGGVSAGGVSSADDEVKKVQAWIAAYKKRSGMA